jgi:hypothetical protein
MTQKMQSDWLFVWLAVVGHALRLVYGRPVEESRDALSQHARLHVRVRTPLSAGGATTLDGSVAIIMQHELL